jgi:hypothetical protein
VAVEGLRGERLRLLHDGGQDVARLHLLTPRALHVEDGGLQHAAERERLIRLALLAARELLDRFLQVVVQLAPKLRQVRAAGGEDLLAVRVVREGVEQMFQRQVRVPPRRRLAEGDGQHDFEGGAEHGLSRRP